MTNLKFYHGSKAYFTKPDPAFLGEGLTHSENGWGFYVSEDKYTAGEHAGIDVQTKGVLYSFEFDETWINENILVSDQPIGPEKYHKLLDALDDLGDEKNIAAELNPEMNGREVFSLLNRAGQEMRPKTRSGAEFLAAHGIKGAWYKGEHALCLFDMEDVPLGRIEQICGHVPEAEAALQHQNLNDFDFLLKEQPGAIQLSVQAFMDFHDFDISEAESLDSLPAHNAIMRFLKYDSPSYLETGIANLTNPDSRILLGEIHNTAFPDNPITVESVPEDEIEHLSLRDKVEMRYIPTSVMCNALKAVYATGDEYLIQSVERYAENIDLGPGAKFDRIANSVGQAIEKALGYGHFSMPKTPDKMGEEIEGTIERLNRQKSENEALKEQLGNIQEAIISYGEKYHGQPRAAHAPPPRNNPEELINQGNYFSGNLSQAARKINKTENADLIERFNKLAAVLVSDKYNAHGLAKDSSQTLEQSRGFDLRDGIGIAISRLLDDGGQDPDHFGGVNTWARNKQQLLEIGGDDPELVNCAIEFERSLSKHIKAELGHMPDMIGTITETDDSSAGCAQMPAAP